MVAVNVKGLTTGDVLKGALFHHLSTLHYCPTLRLSQKNTLEGEDQGLSGSPYREGFLVFSEGNQIRKPTVISDFH
jgi:hypothetical protein